MEEMPKDERHVSMTIKGISKASYNDLCAKIDALRKEFLDRDDQKEFADRIVSLNIQLFPVMKIDRSGGERGRANE
jgi:uncharacterized protein (TIGR02147 family)